MASAGDFVAFSASSNIPPNFNIIQFLVDSRLKSPSLDALSIYMHRCIETELTVPLPGESPSLDHGFGPVDCLRARSAAENFCA